MGNLLGEVVGLAVVGFDVVGDLLGLAVDLKWEDDWDFLWD